MNDTDQPSGLDQVRALSHPLRLRLIELFAREAITTKQAAEQLGAPPTRLYHHVAALERAGLIRLKETRPNRGTTEKYYETVSRRIEPPRGAMKKSRHADHAALGMVVFDEARNELVRALGAGLAEGRTPMIATRCVLRMSPRAVRAVAAELKRLLRRLGTSAERTRTRSRRRTFQRYSLTIGLIPTPEP